MDLTDFYRDVITEHSKSPRNFRVIESPTATAEGRNPICGDVVHVYLTHDGETITDVAFQGESCGMCTTSASLLTRQLKGVRIADVPGLADRFVRAMVDPEEPDWASDELAPIEDLAPLGFMRKLPMRVKCVTLPWHTVKAALAGDATASTEEGGAQP